MSSLIDLLKKTHHAEWEATPSWHDATAWLDDLIRFLFPSNNLPKKTSYEGILKKNQIDLENILLSYLDPKKIAIEQKVASFYDELETIYKNLRLDASKIHEYDPAATSVNEVIVSHLTTPTPRLQPATGGHIAFLPKLGHGIPHRPQYH